MELVFFVPSLLPQVVQPVSQHAKCSQDSLTALSIGGSRCNLLAMLLSATNVSFHQVQFQVHILLEQGEKYDALGVVNHELWHMESPLRCLLVDTVKKTSFSPAYLVSRLSSFLPVNLSAGCPHQSVVHSGP